VLLAVAEHEQIHSDLIPRIATGFCSGVARTGGMCGAVSGGIMALSLLYGRSSPTQPVDPCYKAVRLFFQQFSSRFKAVSCLELIGVRLDTPEGQAAFREHRLIEHCLDYVAVAANLVEDIIEEKQS
jgi:C_GCAxxG_C_C family probable redox protein